MPVATPAADAVTRVPLPRSGAVGEPEHRRKTCFFAGRENRLAPAAVVSLMPVGEEPSPPVAAKALTLIGPAGSGKTLLAAGLAEAWRRAAGDDAVVCLSGVDFRRRVEQALARERHTPGALDDLVRRLASVRLLVVEDLEGISASAAAVDRFRCVADELSAAGGVLLVTAKRPPGEITGLDARVVSRLVAGLVVEVAAPDTPTRTSLLIEKLGSTGRRIDPAAAQRIAQRLPSDARRVLAAADRLARRFPRERTIGPAEADAFLATGDEASPSPALSDIAAMVARYYSLPQRQLRSSSRKAPIVLARAVVVYLARRFTPLSYDDIGRYLGGRDHTTIMHNLRRIERRLPIDRALRSAVDELAEKLGLASRRGDEGSVAW